MADELRTGYAPPMCAKHRLYLDEDGGCPRCRQEQWLFDDLAAKRGTIVPDDSEPRGPEN